MGSPPVRLELASLKRPRDEKVDAVAGTNDIVLVSVDVKQVKSDTVADWRRSAVEWAHILFKRFDLTHDDLLHDKGLPFVNTLS